MSPRFCFFPPDECFVCHAVSLHLTGKDRWEEFDATVMFVLIDFSQREDCPTEAMQLRCMSEDFGGPVVLTCRMAAPPGRQQDFFKSVGLTRMPVTWSDESQNVYEVYVKGLFDMGGFVNLMERVEYIGKEIVYKHYEEEV